MGDRPVFSEKALRFIAEDKIRSAINRGDFDNLPGLGEPSPLIDEPYDPMWWVRRKLQREQIRTEGDWFAT